MTKPSAPRLSASPNPTRSRRPWSRAIYADESYLNRIEERVAEKQLVAFVLEHAQGKCAKKHLSDIMTGQALPPREGEPPAASAAAQVGDGGSTEDDPSA